MWMEVSAETVVAEPDPSPVRCHLWASQIFPVPGRTRASEESGGRMAGRYVRLPGVQGRAPEARSEQIMCEVASAAQRGSYLKEAKLPGCRRPRRSPKWNPAGLTNRDQNTVPVWSLEMRSDSWSYQTSQLCTLAIIARPLCVSSVNKRSKAPPCERLIKMQ